MGCLQTRFEGGQENVMKGTMVLPSSTISYESELDWDSTVDEFIQCYIDEVPSHSLHAEK